MEYLACFNIDLMKNTTSVSIAIVTPSEKVVVYRHYSNFLKQVEVILFLKTPCGQYHCWLIMQGTTFGFTVKSFPSPTHPNPSTESRSNIDASVSILIP
jgi:hypothetical protein